MTQKLSSIHFNCFLSFFASLSFVATSSLLLQPCKTKQDEVIIIASKPTVELENSVCLCVSHPVCSVGQIRSGYVIHDYIYMTFS